MAYETFVFGGIPSVQVNRVVRNFAVLFSGNVIGQFMFFFALARLARVLGPAEFGAFNFAQVVMLYLLRGSEFGFETTGIRETSRDTSSTPRWIAVITFLRFGFALSLFGLALIAVSSGLLPSGTGNLVLISGLTVFPMAFLLEWVFEARQEITLVSLARILKGVLFFILVYGAVAGSADAGKASYLYVASVTIPIVFIAVLVVIRFGVDWSAISRSTLTGALRTTAPVGIASLLSQYSLFASTMVVGYMLPRIDLGYFTAANRIVIFLWAYVILSMHRVLLPNLSSRFHASFDDFRRLIGRIFRVVVLVAVPIGLVGTLCSTELMRLLYSSQYEASGSVFAVLLWGFVLANIRSILETALIAADGQRRYMKGMMVLACSYTVLLPLLTSLYGMIGAAIAVVASEFCYFLYLVFSSPYCEPGLLFGHVWKPAVAAVVALALALSLAHVHVLVRVGISSAVFCAGIAALRGVTIDDLVLFRSLFQPASAELTA